MLLQKEHIIFEKNRKTYFIVGYLKNFILTNEKHWIQYKI